MGQAGNAETGGLRAIDLMVIEKLLQPVSKIAGTAGDPDAWIKFRSPERGQNQISPRKSLFLQCQQTAASSNTCLFQNYFYLVKGPCRAFNRK